MQIYYHFDSGTQKGKRRIVHSIIALLTGVLVMVWPGALYLIIGSYLMAIGVIFLLFRAPSFIVLVTMAMGLLIFMYPTFIPFFFGFFLLVTGLATLLGGGFTIVAVIPLSAALLLLLFPDIIALIIAAFLILYGAGSLMAMIRERRKKDDIIEVY